MEKATPRKILLIVGIILAIAGGFLIACLEWQMNITASVYDAEGFRETNLMYLTDKLTFLKTTRSDVFAILGGAILALGCCIISKQCRGLLVAFSTSLCSGGLGYFLLHVVIYFVSDYTFFYGGFWGLGGFGFVIVTLIFFIATLLLAVSVWLKIDRRKD